MSVAHPLLSPRLEIRGQEMLGRVVHEGLELEEKVGAPGRAELSCRMSHSCQSGVALSGSWLLR